MYRKAAFALAILTLGSSAAGAQALTKQQQAACRPDAMKLCSAHIGKPQEMSACLLENKSSLSDACRQVVEAHGG